MQAVRICGLFALVLMIAFPIPGHAQQQKKKAKKKRRPNPAFAPVKDVEGLPRVLLIGDSISIGYTVPVRKQLQGKANLHRPRTNCGPTTRGLEQIEQWLGDGDWDVIHFNWGLHDLKYVDATGKLVSPNDPKAKPQVPIEQYEKNLDALVTRLKKTGAVLIWRNTTPVPEGANGRVVGDAAKYNEAADRVMKKHGVRTHDMFAFVKPRMDKLMRPANVHFTPQGSQKLAETVVAEIEASLKSR